jgi:hypothetical protein
MLSARAQTKIVSGIYAVYVILNLCGIALIRLMTSAPPETPLAHQAALSSAIPSMAVLALVYLLLSALSLRFLSFLMLVLTLEAVAGF